MSARPRSFTGPIHERTHRSAPTRWGRRSGTNGNRRDTTPFLVKGGAGWCVRRRGVVTPPYGCATGDAKQRADVPKAWLPPAKFRSEIWGVSHGHRPLRPAGGREGGTPGSSCPTGGCGEPPRLPWVAAQTGGTGGNRGRDHPKSVQQRRTIPQSAFGRQLPLHKGALPCGGRGMRIAASLRSSQ